MAAVEFGGYGGQGDGAALQGDEEVVEEVGGFFG